MSVSKKERWTEEDIVELPSGEHEYFDRKSGKLVGEADFFAKLAKALSAFANSGGGHLFIGVQNDGTLDGVEPCKGRTRTREWLEQVCPNLVEYALEDFRVHEVEPSTPSSIPEGKVVIVIDVADSPRAPHQSQQDKKYYVRLGGRSEPASHRMIEDIRNRTRHPDLEVAVMEIQDFNWDPTGQDLDRLKLTIKVTLRNVSNMKAQNACLVTTVDYGSFGWLPGLTNVVQPRSNTGQQFFWELQHPVYPGMETPFTFLFLAEAQRWSRSAERFFYIVPRSEPAANLDDMRIGWKLFGDGGRAKEGYKTLGEMGFREKSQVVIGGR